MIMIVNFEVHTGTWLVLSWNPFDACTVNIVLTYYNFGQIIIVIISQIVGGLSWSIFSSLLSFSFDTQGCIYIFVCLYRARHYDILGSLSDLHGR